MHLQAEFRTRIFESQAPKPHFINPCCFGEDLAHWLRPRLTTGLFAVGAPIQEDFGWVMDMTAAKERYLLAVGMMDETADADGALWSIILEYTPTLLQRLFGRPDLELWQAACTRLREVLEAEPAFSHLEWTGTGLR